MLMLPLPVLNVAGTTPSEDYRYSSLHAVVVEAWGFRAALGVVARRAAATHARPAGAADAAGLFLRCRRISLHLIRQSIALALVRAICYVALTQGHGGLLPPRRVASPMSDRA